MKTKRFLSLLLCLCMMLTLLPVMAQAADEAVVLTDKPAYSDLAETDELYPYVCYLVCQGIMGGYPGGTFHPKASLTRAEAVKIAVLAKGLSPISGGSQTFKDVPVGYWAYSYIETAVKAGLIKGYPGGALGPDKPITKAEAVTLLLRLSGGALSVENMSIADVPADNWVYRQAVTAVKAGLLALSSDRLFSPDTVFTRGELARSLSVLFTLGPGLRPAKLVGRLTVTKGQVTVADENGTRSVNTETVVSAGMTIAADDRSQAEISFDDGSGIRMEPGTEISIVRADGFRYMRADGTPAVAIDKLEIKLNKGKIFGALANRNEGSETSGKKPVVTDETWWLYPFSERVRITVEMPAGVAGIWGSFWQNLVNNSGSNSTAVLIGHAEVTSGGQTVSLSGGQATTVSPSSTSAGAAPPPSPAAPMSSSQQQAFGSVSDWVMGRAQDIQDNTPQPPSPPSSQGQSPQQQQLSRQSNVLDAIRDALNHVSSGRGLETSEDSDSGPVYTAPTIDGPDTINLTVGYADTDQAYTFGGDPVPTLTITANTAGATLSGNTLTIPAGLGAGSYSVTLQASSSAGAMRRTITVNVAAAPAAPTISGPDSIDLTAGYLSTDQGYSVSGNPAPALAITASTAGATLSGNTLTIPAGLGAGSYSVTLEARNSAGTATKTITVNVAAPAAPTISGPDSIDLTVGYLSTDQGYTVSGSPSPTLAITANTAGATLSGNTLTIPGGLGVGSYSVTLEASSSAGTATKTVTVNVAAAPTVPTISGPDSIVLPPAYTSGIYPYSVTGSPTAYGITDVSSHSEFFSFDGANLSITSGLDIGYSPFTLTLTATNSTGTATKDVTIYVISLEPASLGVDEGQTEAETLSVHGAGNPGTYTLHLGPGYPDWVTLSDDTLTVSPPTGTVTNGSSEDFTVDVIISVAGGSSITTSVYISVTLP